MSQLILMRQRIAAIETIKKITHAMQLISMSAHARLRQKKIFIEQYRQAINDIACSLQQYTSAHYESPFENPYGTQRLVIIVGSQKGLSGTFNANLYKFFKEQEVIEANQRIIMIGKVGVDFFSYQGITPDLAYTNFTTANYEQLATILTQNILTDLENLKEVVAYYMFPKSFFSQEPRKVILFPLMPLEQQKAACPSDTREILWESDPELILQFMQELNLQATVLEVLFSSLLAEQAARFISMENATRNADNLLSDMKLDYNKTRQARITLELTDLIAGMVNT